MNERSIGLLTLCVAVLLSAGCAVHPVDELGSEVCGADGEDVAMPTERSVCVYRWPIVIETGFDCPAQRQHQFDFPQHFAACAAFDPLTDPEIEFLLRRYEVPREEWPQQKLFRPKTDAVDLLWVIDNSGSMCQEQKMLRDNFERFVEGLIARNIDFHMGVTTTQMTADYPMEPVARPGQLQATPQPVPADDPDNGCHTALDAMGEPVQGDYTPIRDMLEVAVSCMREPAPQQFQWTDADIECALYNRPTGCTIAQVGCGGDARACSPQDLFPPADSYRPLPRVLRSTDYRQADGSLDVGSMKADFACMSLVGTRGHGIEKGLGAAVAAVGPEMTGGAAGDEAPNAGLLRADARFGLVIVSDENDCTHDGRLDESTACGGEVCEFANHPDAVDSPLLDVASLKEQLLDNLSESKGRAVGENEVYVASLHGQSQRYTGPILEPAQCADPDYQGITPTCATSLGITFSGDRYERFARQFPQGNFFPAVSDDDPMIGWLCQGDFTPAVEAMGDFLSRSTE